MSRIFLYAHGGSGNHGCEAIVRSTMQILQNEKACLISSRPDEDKRYGINKICDIVKDKSDSISKFSIDFWRAYIALKVKKDFVPMDKLWYKETFSYVHKGDIALSIGGDNYCYADVSRYIMLHDMLKKRGAKTVLWGCSVEPDVVVQPEITADLARYDLITARESISYKALKAVNPNTYLVADPAFVLRPLECNLPEGFVPGNTVGVNLSPMAIEREVIPGIAYENYRNLITHIIENTDMQIALVPHVVWEDSDDRHPLGRLYSEFKQTGRVVMVEDRDCQSLKYVISKCKFFVGARTHATIAAYSSCIPTLVLGYSVKSRGIARDLFGEENAYVLPVQNICHSTDVTDYFLAMVDNERSIIAMLSKVIPRYEKRSASVDGIMPQNVEVKK